MANKTIKESIKDLFLGLGGNPSALADNADTSDYIDDLESAIKANDLEQWNQMLLEKLKFDFNCMDPVYSKLVLQCILKQKSLENPAYEPYYSKWHNAMKGGLK